MLTFHRLRDLEGEWHEFESKALRREKEKQERDARRAAKEGSSRDKDKKRPPSTHESQRDSKRPHIDGQPPTLGRASSSNVVQSGEPVAGETVPE